METNLKYKISDYPAFINGFYGLVDTSVDIIDYQLNPDIVKLNYFGKFEWGKFTIYDRHKYFLRRKIALKVKGEIKGGVLFLNIRHSGYWSFFVSSIGLTLIGVFMVFYPYLFYAGLGLLLINLLQIYHVLRFYNKRKETFLQSIEEII